MFCIPFCFLKRPLNILCTIFFSIFLLISFGCQCSYAKPNDLPVVDEDLKHRLETLKKEEDDALNQTYSCQVTWNIRTLEPVDRYSPSKPNEVTFLYDNKEIMRLSDSSGEWPKKEGNGIQCIKWSNFVYIFWDAVVSGEHWRFNLNPESYVIYSHDNGISWSKFQSLSQLSKASIFVLLKKELFHYRKILGDEKGHLIVIYNLRDNTTYVFDAHLKLLEKVVLHQQIPGFDPTNEFHFYNGKVYLVHRHDCGKRENDGTSCIDISKDYGQSWKRSPMPYVTSTRFITHNGSLYHFYIEPCPPSLRDFIPALGNQYICGQLKVSKLDANNQWSEPKTLLKTADKLRDVYSNKSLIITWQDFRFSKPRDCGFIPLIGCVDSIPFNVSWAVYAGEFDPEPMTLKETLIEYRNK